MKTSQLMGLVLVVVAFVSLAAIWFYPSFQAFMASNAVWNGINRFDKEFNVQNADSLATLGDTTKQNVLIVIPRLPYSSDEMKQMQQFIENGGKVIMMDDFGYGNSFLQYAGIPARFINVPLLDPLFNYKNEYFPKIMDFVTDISNSGIKVIALNHGTALSNVSQSEALAWSSIMSFLDTNQNGNWDQDEAKGPFVVAASYNLGKGTIDLVSDPSLIMNATIDGNDNEAFVKYLINASGTPANILLDRSHLTKSLIDNSKIKLAGVRRVISNPDTLVGLIALVFVIITWYLYRRGQLIG